MTNNERIEAYFDNSLSETEKQNLLSELDSNPELKNEFEFQKDVIDGIKAYRKNELITRLDNVKIVSTGQTALLKTIAAIGIIGAGSFGIYLWLDNLDNKEPSDQQTTNQTEQVVSSKTDQAATEGKTPPETEIIEEVEGSVEVAEESEKVKVKESPDTEVPDVAIPEFKEPETDSTIESDDDLKSPIAASESTIGLSTRTDVEIVMSKKYKFHYQTKDGKLVLYGDFEDIPFEIIELKSNDRLQTYLFYQDNFFELNEDSEEIRPLEAVTNKKLIEELQNRR